MAKSKEEKNGRKFERVRIARNNTVKFSNLFHPDNRTYLPQKKSNGSESARNGFPDNNSTQITYNHNFQRKKISGLKKLAKSKEAKNGRKFERVRITENTRADPKPKMLNKMKKFLKKLLPNARGKPRVTTTGGTCSPKNLNYQGITEIRPYLPPNTSNPIENSRNGVSINTINPNIPRSMIPSQIKNLVETDTARQKNFMNDSNLNTNNYAKVNERESSPTIATSGVKKNTIAHRLMSDNGEEDALPVGGSFKPAEKAPHILRFSCINPNGTTPSTVQDTIQHALESQIDLQCYSEVNLDTMQPDNRIALQENTNKMDPAAKSVWGTSTLPSLSNFKPGGTAVVAFSRLSSRVKKTGLDPLGRWTYMTLSAHGNKEILLISIYQCGPQPTNEVGNTAFHQQRILLSEMNRTDVDPRKNFYRDLKQFIQTETSKDDILTIPILMGDFNDECTGVNPSKLCSDFNLVDVWSQKHPNLNPRTYQRGKRRLDFILAPQIVSDAVENIVYEPFQYRIKGDHRGLVIDFNERLLFGNAAPAPFGPKGRAFSSKDKNAVSKFLEEVHLHFQANRVIERVNALMESIEPNPTEAEALDREITRAVLHAENKIRRRRQEYWSIDLHKTRIELSIWCQYRSRKKRNLTCASLTTRAEAFGVEIGRDTSLEIANTEIDSISKNIKTIRANSEARRLEFQLTNANDAEDCDDQTRAKIIRSMMNTETQARAFRKYKSMAGGDCSGLSRLEV